jgi:transcriptional regulator with XRE-family HTH domain
LKTKTEILKTFSENLVILREKRFKSQREAARKCNIPFQTYRNYEIGKSLPTVFEILKILDTFEIDIRTLFHPFIEKLDEDLIDKFEKLRLIKTSGAWDWISIGINSIYNQITEKKIPPKSERKEGRTNSMGGEG